MTDAIQEGFEVFMADGEAAVGAVRHAPSHGAKEFVIYVEKTGDFLVPLSAVKDVHSGKVILNHHALHQELQQAIRHAHEEQHDDQA